VTEAHGVSNKVTAPENGGLAATSST
jgi:hypothetical protein